MKSCLNIRCIFSLSELVEAEKLLDLHVYYSNGLVPQELYRSVVDCHVRKVWQPRLRGAVVRVQGETRQL